MIVGVERAVTRWYTLRQCLADEIARLEGALEPPLIAVEDVGVTSGEEAVDSEVLQQQLAKAQERLRLLGPCPKPMMG